MSTETANYNLTKPDVNENYDIGVPNANMDIIDTQLKANADAVAGKLSNSLATEVSQFLVSTAAGAWAVKTVAEIKTLLGLGSAAYTESAAYATATHKARHATGGADALSPDDIGAAERISGTGTLAVASWAGSAVPYSYELTVAGMLATDTPHVDRVTGTDAAAAALINTAWGLIAGYAVKPQTSAGKITFYASAKPAVAIPIMYEVVRS